MATHPFIDNRFIFATTTKKRPTLTEVIHDRADDDDDDDAADDEHDEDVCNDLKEEADLDNHIELVIEDMAVKS